MSKAPQPVVNDRPQKRYIDVDEAVQYLHDLGFASVTANTIKSHAYRTGKLARPKVIGRRRYWSRADLDKLVENL